MGNKKEGFVRLNRGINRGKETVGLWMKIKLGTKIFSRSKCVTKLLREFTSSLTSLSFDFELGMEDWMIYR